MNEGHLRGLHLGEVFEWTEISGTSVTEIAVPPKKRFFYPGKDGHYERGDDQKSKRMMPPAGEVDGAKLTYVSASGVKVGTAGQDSKVSDSSRQFLIEFSGELTADITVSGVGGLRSGLSEAANTWYRVFLIADSTTVSASPAAFLDTSEPPVLPAKYDIYRRVGWVRNNASSNFRKFFQNSNGPDRRYEYDVERSNLLALSGGNATVFTDVNLTSFVPPTARLIFMTVTFNSPVSSRRARLRTKGSTVALPPTFLNARGGNIALSSFIEMLTDTMQRIQYNVDNVADSLDIFVRGFRDDL